MKKIDMSISCGLCQEAMALKEYQGEISHEAFRHWYDNHCAKCIHESEVCMYGENDPPIDHEHPELAGLPVCNNYKADNVETVEAEENSFSTIVDVNGIEHQVEASQLRAYKALLGNFNGMLFGYKKHVESLWYGLHKEVAEYIMTLPDYNVRYR